VQLSCPCCGAQFQFDAATNDADARRFGALMGDLPPPVARLIPAYLLLFRPRKQGLRWSRLLSLMQEIAADILSGQVERHGRAWAAPAAVWVQALETVTAKTDLVLPLKGHGLLREIAAAAAGKVEARGERQTEQRRMARPAGPTLGPAPVRDVLDRAAGRKQAASLKRALTSDDDAP
jgi:hypothetical protein